MISLKELIEQGTKIREGISFVPPGKGLRTFKVYKLADSQCYTDWKGLVNRYLQVLHVGAEAEEVKNDIKNNPQRFEVKNHLWGLCVYRHFSN